MGTVQLTFAVVLCGGATGSQVTGCDLKSRDRSPVPKYVLRMRNRK